MKNILRLLKLEYTKFRKNSVICLLTIFFVIMLPTVTFIGKEFNNVPPPLPNNTVFFEFPSVWDYLGFAGNWLTFFFLGLIAVFIVVNEVSYRTFRQNIITGLTRKEYFFSKILTISVITSAATLLFVVTGFLIGIIHTEGWTISSAFDNSWAIPRFFLMTLGYMSFGLFCGFVIRKSGVAVLFYLTYIMMLEPIIKWAVHFRLFKNGSINYYPSNSFEDLMPFPLYRFADMIPKKDLDFSFLLSYNQAAIASVVWIAIFLGLAYLSVMKKDV